MLRQLLHERVDLRLRCRRPRPASARRGSGPPARSPANARAPPSADCRRRARRLRSSTEGVLMRSRVDVPARQPRSAERRSCRATRPRRGSPAWCWRRPASRARRRAAGGPPAHSRCRARSPPRATRCEPAGRAGGSLRSRRAPGRRAFPASSVRPEPTSPATPRISPRRTSTTRRGCRAHGWSGRAAPAPRRRAHGRLGKTAATSRPTIRRISSRGRSSPRRRCGRPSRHRGAP